MRPTTFANITADTLSTGACRQITRFLRSSAGLERTGLTQEEAETMRRAADALDEVLSWQTPKEAANG